MDFNNLLNMSKIFGVFSKYDGWEERCCYIFQHKSKHKKRNIKSYIIFFFNLFRANVSARTLKINSDKFFYTGRSSDRELPFLVPTSAYLHMYTVYTVIDVES